MTSTSFSHSSGRHLGDVKPEDVSCRCPEMVARGLKLAVVYARLLGSAFCWGGPSGTGEVPLPPPTCVKMCNTTLLAICRANYRRCVRMAGNSRD